MPEDCYRDDQSWADDWVFVESRFNESIERCLTASQQSIPEQYQPTDLFFNHKYPVQMPDPEKCSAVPMGMNDRGLTIAVQTSHEPLRSCGLIMDCVKLSTMRLQLIAIGIKALPR